MQELVRRLRQRVSLHRPARPGRIRTRCTRRFRLPMCRRWRQRCARTHWARLVSVFAEDRTRGRGCLLHLLRLRASRRALLSDSARPHPGRRPALSLARARIAGGELAGARDPGLVRHRSGRPSQSAPRGPARRLAGCPPAAQGLSRSTRCCRRSRASGTSTGRRWAKAFSRCRWARCTPASSSRATSTSRWRASRSSICNCGCSTRTRGRRSCSSTCRWPQAVFLAESVSGDSAFSHATAFCQAVEKAADIDGARPRAR